GSVALGQGTGPLAHEFDSRHVRVEREGVCPDIDTPTAILEIAIERTVCFGSCPNYTLILRSNGTAEYEGREFTRRKGRFVGRVEVEEFERLARYALAIGFFTLNDVYSCGVTDNPTVYVAVASADRRKLVYHYAPFHQTAPATLDV